MVKLNMKIKIMNNLNILKCIYIKVDFNIKKAKIAKK